METADKNASELNSGAAKPVVNALQNPPEKNRTGTKQQTGETKIATDVEDHIPQLAAILRLKNAEDVAKLVT